ncbi:ArfGap-domain-containing protein [Hymenopellis radicata]|nr:ArfGap-domain-containing protein [Hymenopellis radicata]
MTSKITSERSQKLVQELALQPGNDICADCKAKNPRWASHSLGIFLCMHCASIHRKIGTHITKVKSITMDLWTKEQAENMKNIGNVKSNAIYNPNELKHPPPPPLMDATRDTDLEQYIRSKYEYKRFFDKAALVASKLGPSRSATAISPRPQTTPLEKQAPAAPSRPSTAALPQQSRSASQPAPQPAVAIQPRPSMQMQPPPQPQQQQQLQNGVWADLVQLQTSASGPSLPLQYQQPSMSMSPSLPILNTQFQPQQPMMMMNATGFGQSPYNPFLQQQQQFQQPQQQQQFQQPNNNSTFLTSLNFMPQQQQPQQQQQYALPPMGGGRGRSRCISSHRCP